MRKNKIPKRKPDRVDLSGKLQESKAWNIRVEHKKTVSIQKINLRNYRRKMVNKHE